MWVYLLCLSEHTRKYETLYPKIVPVQFRRVACRGEVMGRGRGKGPHPTFHMYLNSRFSFKILDLYLAMRESVQIYVSLKEKDDILKEKFKFISTNTYYTPCSVREALPGSLLSRGIVIWSQMVHTLGPCTLTRCMN